ncbi:PAS domain-containing protein [Piscinibacter sp. HJYY11]|uniref:PAS domain-containing protein n=1 Tax=Piscinibacter sp. HJYY11 TaxID=2801333 RepID=UPI00191CDE6A|nr:PAS domain-containing protein [Piscinibacter sp. HJYY11]MBL0728546.1 PAS domain-containing protein [Piscinibacter sp. HJYY11]
MRIRVQVIAAVATSLVAGLASLAVVMAAARQSDAAGEAQRRAQVTAHEVAGLLTLTQEYARYAEPRAAQQWHQRHATIAKTLGEGRSGVIDSMALTELHSVVGALPPLFFKLESLPPGGEAFAARRKEMLVDQLLTSTQAMSDYAYQWFLDASQVKAQADEQFRAVAFFVPGLLLAFLCGVALLVRQRVLVPLTRLEAAARALGAGDMAHRIASTERNELGDLARQFDAMSVALSESRERLQRSEQQLRAITDNMPALIAYVNRDQRYEFANQRYLDWWNTDPASMLGRHMREMLTPEIYEGKVRERIEEALAGQRVQWTSSSRRSGSERHYQIDYIPDVAPDGSVRGCYAMMVDITERHEAEQRVAASEQRLLDLLNSIPAMVGYFDMQERCLYANDAGLKSNGLERSQIPGLSMRAALGDANYAQHEPSVQEVLQGRRARFQGKLPFQGRTAHFQAHLIPDRLEGGAQRGFYLMTFDITAMKEAQLEQARAEGRLRAITDNLPVLIAYIDQDERYRFANQTLREWMGVEPAAAIGRRKAEVVTAAHYAQVQPFLQRALMGERVTFEIESELLGVKRSLQGTYLPDIQPDGSVAGVYALSTDVSAMKQVQQRLSELVRIDTLTGLANRYQFNEVLPMALMRGERAGTGTALMFLDVDRFKEINDTHGHVAGDEVLRLFADRLRRCVRMTDTVARFAGDEFVILLEGLRGDAEPEQVAQKIIACMEEPVALQGGGRIVISTSVGVAYCAPGRAQLSVSELLAHADKALYVAKRAGRNTYRFAQEAA